MPWETAKQHITELAHDLLLRVGFNGEVKISDSGTAGLPVVCIESADDLSMLIGKNGQNLNALEHLLRVIAFRKNPEQPAASFILDINDYRRAKVSQLITLARAAAGRVISTQRAEALAPMSAYERRLVHTELAGYRELQTESIGAEPRRRIVIKPLAANI